jgi:hypothetical protein
MDFVTEPEHWRFGGGATDTVLHPIVLLALFVAIIMILALPKKCALAAFLLSTFLIPLGQQVVVGGVHLFVYRIIVATGWVRIARTLSSGQSKMLGGGWNTLDKVFLLYVVCRVVAVSLLNANGAAVVNQVGFVWDFVGGYILLRHLIQHEEDVTQMIKWLAYVTLILSVCMVGEQLTGKNIFGVLGGVRLMSEVRAGRIRSEAVFQHSILAGVFGATMMPLFIWLWKSARARILSVVGVLGATVIVLTSASSTAFGAYGMACLGLCLWAIRRRMRVLRWALGIALVGLQLLMNAPVWALVSRIDVMQGSSSYHRYRLIDQFIRHWSEWCLIGTNSNASWGDFMFDTSNQYVVEGTTGGLLGLVLLIYQISWCFGRIGTARKAAERRDRSQAWLPWLLGVSLLAHITAFFGISYFDQMRVSWFALLAMISVVTSRGLLSQRKEPAVDDPAHLISSAEAHAGGCFWGGSLQPLNEREI